jgi:hypothetical protein
MSAHEIEYKMMYVYMSQYMRGYRTLSPTIISIIKSSSSTGEPVR